MSTVAVSGLVIGLVVLLSFILLVVIAVVSLLARKKSESARKEHPDARHIEGGALFFGQKSRGASQARGNGTLIFGASEILFKQWVVGREFRIPYRSIQSVETPRSFLGKAQGVDLLQVNYLDDNGNPDAMAWRVSDLGAAMRTIDEARRA